MYQFPTPRTMKRTHRDWRDTDDLIARIDATIEPRDDKAQKS